ncbi:hypothetical protein B0H10DRAFT_2106689 [Mycena sp. CBHHK59/15]|nr:hypothetical protein B0H10DRAFT_2106689 [Mycena sp. CBHHK59/15]
MSTFPTEVWRMSWSHAPTPELKSLSSSCRLFRDICQPLLFQTLSFVGPFPEEMVPRSRKALTKRLERSEQRLISLASDPRIASMVHAWSYHCSPAIDLSQEETTKLPALTRLVELSRAINARFSSTIGAYINLSRLLITGIDLSPEFCKRLASMSKLSVMHMIDCDITCPASSGGPDMEWKDDTVERYNLVSPRKLVQLDLMEEVPARVFLSVFALAGPIPHLVTVGLRLSHEAKDVFFAFLDCCPALTCLTIDAPASFTGVTLPASTVPVLASFQGPMELIGVFAAGRPIRRAKLDFFSDEHDHDHDVHADKAVVQEGLLQLSKSSATVEDITLPLISPKWSVLFMVSELFPKLKKLMLFLRDVGVPWSAESDDSQGSDSGDWETVDGSDEGEDGEDIETDNDGDGELTADDGLGLPGPFDIFRGLLNMTAQDMDQARQALEMGDADVGHGSHDCDDCDDCDGGNSECSDTSAFIVWPDEVLTRTYEDLSLDSFMDVMLSLGNDTTPLPRNIRHLAIGQMHETLDVKAMSDADVSAIVEKLGARYPGLRQVVVGKSPRAWKRRRGVWKAPRPQHLFAFKSLPIRAVHA